VLHNARVVRRKRDHLGNPTGRANANPILDTRSYIVQFEESDETELTANTIADAIYAQCDPDGNQYLLLEALIDHRCNDNAVKLADQMTVHDNGKHKTNAARPLDGRFAASGGMVPPPGKTFAN
jgi:hypothetical protein